MLDEIRDRQCGVVTRPQALASGLSPDAIRQRLRTGRWQTVFRSVYATFSGPLTRECRLWAAVLRAGPGAVLSHQSAAEVTGLVDEPQSSIHVTVPANRRVRAISGVVVHHCQRVHESRHPTRLPPQTRIEETVIDLTQVAGSLERALGVLARAVGRRLTTADRLVGAIGARTRVRWRAELLAALSDVADGAHSSLELRYLRDVERAHGLPSGRRQYVVRRGDRRCYDDVRYPDLETVVELDGRAAHPSAGRWRDMRRDNASVVDGRRVLRYGWTDVVERPCEVAAQVAEVLRAAGWRGVARRCRPDCTMIRKTLRSHHPTNSSGS